MNKPQSASIAVFCSLSAVELAKDRAAVGSVLAPLLYSEPTSSLNSVTHKNSFSHNAFKVVTECGQSVKFHPKIR